MVGEDRGDRVRGSLYIQLALLDPWVSSDEQAMLNEKNTADNLLNAMTLQQSSHPFLNYLRYTPTIQAHMPLIAHTLPLQVQSRHYT